MLYVVKMKEIWIERNEHQVMSTYYSAALLRNPGYKKDSWEDFKKVFFKYREFVDPDHTLPNILVKIIVKN
jgi:DNA polymerase